MGFDPTLNFKMRELLLYFTSAAVWFLRLSYSAAQASLELTAILLPQPPRCWAYTSTIHYTWPTSATLNTGCRVESEAEPMSCSVTRNSTHVQCTANSSVASRCFMLLLHVGPQEHTGRGPPTVSGQCPQSQQCRLLHWRAVILTVAETMFSKSIISLKAEILPEARKYCHDCFLWTDKLTSWISEKMCQMLVS